MIKFGVKKVECKNIALGQILPRITGIRVSWTKNLEMIIDLNLNYTGDARVHFEMETVFGGKLPFYLRNVSFAGEVQINMGSLCEKFPIIPGVKVKRPHFNYLYLHKLSLETNNLNFRKAFRSLGSCLVIF